MIYLQNLNLLVLFVLILSNRVIINLHNNQIQINENIIEILDSILPDQIEMGPERNLNLIQSRPNQSHSVTNKSVQDKTPVQNNSETHGKCPLHTFVSSYLPKQNIVIYESNFQHCPISVIQTVIQVIYINDKLKFNFQFQCTIIQTNHYI